MLVAKAVLWQGVVMAHRTPSEDLLALARSAPADRDATLLRATTALFCQEPTHDRDAIRRYEQLATYFLPKASEPDRSYVGAMLAGRPDAPAAVMRLLARDVISVAAPVLRQSPVLSTVDLLGVIAVTGVDHHRLVAARQHLSPEVLRALEIAGESYRASAGPAEPEPAARAPADRFEDEDGIAWSAPPPPQRPTARDLDMTSHVMARFLDLPTSARLQVIGEVAGRQGARPPGSPANQLDQAVRSAYARAQIVICSRRGDRPGLVQAFADVLQVDPELIDRLIADPSGEPMVLMIKASGLNDADGRSVLLLANPEIGQSVERFFRLAELFASVEPAVASSFVDAWRDRPTPRPQHAPVYAEGRERPVRPAERAAPAVQPDTRWRTGSDG